MNATTHNETTRNTEREATRERVLRVANWLMDGILRAEAVLGAMREWQLSRRSAQVYVQKAARRIAKLAEFDDPLFALKLSQLQRDRLFQQLQNLQTESVDMEPHEIRSFIQTIQAQLKVLDSRDRTAAKIAQLEGRVAERRKGTGLDHVSHPPIAAQVVGAAEDVRTVEPAPAQPETMRSAAQVTRQPRQSGQPKPKPRNGMQRIVELPSHPAPGDENCALETRAVGHQSAVAVAAA